LPPFKCIENQCNESKVEKCIPKALTSALALPGKLSAPLPKKNYMKYFADVSKYLQRIIRYGIVD